MNIGFLIFKEQSCPVILSLDFLKEIRMCICVYIFTQQKWLTLNEVERVNIDNGIKQVYLR